MKKVIVNFDNPALDDNKHGYYEYYTHAGMLWCKCKYAHNAEIGYEEVNMRPEGAIGELGTRFNFYIR